MAPARGANQINYLDKNPTDFPGVGFFVCKPCAHGSAGVGHVIPFDITAAIVLVLVALFAAAAPISANVNKLGSSIE